MLTAISTEPSGIKSQRKESPRVSKETRGCFSLGLTLGEGADFDLDVIAGAQMDRDRVAIGFAHLKLQILQGRGEQVHIELIVIVTDSGSLRI